MACRDMLFIVSSTGSNGDLDIVFVIGISGGCDDSGRVGDTDRIFGLTILTLDHAKRYRARLQAPPAAAPRKRRTGS